jgi:hypothetical protein
MATGKKGSLVVTMPRAFPGRDDAAVSRRERMMQPDSNPQTQKSCFDQEKHQIKTALVEIQKLLWGPEARVRDPKTKRFVADELTRLANEFKALAERIVREQTGGG